jgi:transcriptional regulator with XRE-family HTH domain
MAERKIRTMDEFAAASGLSRPTVSKYFNDLSSVRPTTRERIEKALNRRDYRPNLFSVNLNRRSTRTGRRRRGDRASPERPGGCRQGARHGWRRGEGVRAA